MQKVIPFDESIKVATKHHKWKRIISVGGYGHHIKNQLFYYRMHERNLSGIGSKILKNRTNKGEDKILSGYWARVIE